MFARPITPLTNPPPNANSGLPPPSPGAGCLAVMGEGPYLLDFSWPPWLTSGSREGQASAKVRLAQAGIDYQPRKPGHFNDH